MLPLRFPWCSLFFFFSLLCAGHIELHSYFGIHDKDGDGRDEDVERGSGCGGNGGGGVGRCGCGRAV